MRPLQLAAIAIAFGMVTGATIAEEYKLGDLMIDQPWARETAASQRNGAAYLTVHSAGDGDRLIAARTDIAEAAQLHSHSMTPEGVMKMREVQAVEIPAGGEALLQPGGFHIMLIDLHQPLKEGSAFPLTLVFEKAGEVQVEVTVESIRGGPMQQGAGASHGGDMRHGTDMQHGQPKSD